MLVGCVNIGRTSTLRLGQSNDLTVPGFASACETRKTCSVETMLSTRLWSASRRNACSTLRHCRRQISTVGPSSPQPPQSRFDRFNARLPRFLQRYTTPLRNAPVSHITAFLILHELTAVIPLFGLAATFHYTQWLPPYISEGKWVSDGVQKFGNYFRRKGWLGEESGGREKWWGRSEGSVRIVVE